MTEIGSKVEPFRLVRAVGEVVTSDALIADGPLVLHFFPFAFTGSFAAGSGCEAQVFGFGARLEEFEAPADGLDYEICFGSGDKMKVSQVWDTQEQLDAFGARLMPILAELGIDPGEPEVVGVHSTIRR